MEIQSPILPIVGPPPKRKSSPAPKVLIAALVVGLLGFAGARWWRARSRGPSFPAATVSSSPVVPPSAPAPPQSDPSGPAAARVGANGSGPAALEPQARKAGPRHLSVTIGGPLENTLVDAVGLTLGRSLAQVLSRALVWWVAVPGDLRRGDKLETLFEERPDQEPLVHLLRFTSGKMGQTFAAYRFKPSGAAFARYFQPNGTELELRLKDAPLDDYEQVTSLIHDGRRHKGVDFKTPVGSLVRATFDGTVKRKTWHFRGNGNSVEIVEDAPPYRSAMFLHLSPLPRNLQVGSHIKKGEVFASSGNTGRSFAPHLHYQLMLGQKLLDPFRVHATYRKTLGAEDKGALEAEIQRLDSLIGVPIAGK